MKKFVFILTFNILNFCNLNAQEAKPKPLKILKFHPFSLITGSLGLSQETFNLEKKRSTLVSFGLRYLNKENDNVYYGSTTANSLLQKNKVTGGSLGIDRRFYVPALQSGEKLGFLPDKAQLGVFLSTGLRFDYNSNTYDKSYYTTIYDPAKPGEPQTGTLVENKGKINYLGVMPNMNIGLQFTIFQNLYIETFLGGGIRFMDKKIVSKTQTVTNQQGYFGENLQFSAFENFILREGVQANFGFSLGLIF